MSLLASFLLFIFSSLVFFFFFFLCTKNPKKLSSSSSPSVLPKSYPLIGCYLELKANRDRIVQWTTSFLKKSHSSTIKIYLFGRTIIFTANPANVNHILKTNFDNYQKGGQFRNVLFDFLGDGIFNVDGLAWKFQRQLSSHEFNTKSLRKFVENVVELELSDRLIPILSTAAADKTVIDFQDVLQRFAFDNIGQIAFGYDPAYLTPSFPEAEFAIAFDDAVLISSDRFQTSLPLVWKTKRFLNIDSEKRMKIAVSQVREFARTIMREKRKQIEENHSSDSPMDLLSRFLTSDHNDEKFVTDIIISFILAGRDTTSAALTWFFWLISKNPEAEKQILDEIKVKSNSSIFEDIKDMVFTHASLCESMRLYPPVPTDSKVAQSDDVLPDATVVKKGTRVSYHSYAMGRMEGIWGKDWAEFKPERWLKKEEDQQWSFVGRDSYTYPVFQAGPRICLGKEMAFLQMKRVVAGVLGRFKVVPVMDDGAEPVFVAKLTAKMKDGFHVRIQERSDSSE